MTHGRSPWATLTKRKPKSWPRCIAGFWLLGSSRRFNLRLSFALGDLLTKKRPSQLLTDWVFSFGRRLVGRLGANHGCVDYIGGECRYFHPQFSAQRIGQGISQGLQFPAVEFRHSIQCLG